MGCRRVVEPRPWSLFVIPLAIAAAVVAGILLGGPSIGFILAAVIALLIVTFALGDGRRPADGSWQRDAARRLLVPVAVAVAGLVLSVAASGALRVIGWGVLAVAVTLALSLAFLEVGYSEDRARARGEEPSDSPDRARSRTRHL
jgi:hypothetical protein